MRNNGEKKELVNQSAVLMNNFMSMQSDARASLLLLSDGFAKHHPAPPPKSISRARRFLRPFLWLLLL